MYLEINCICESDSPRIFLSRYVRALLENMSLLCLYYVIIMSLLCHHYVIIMSSLYHQKHKSTFRVVSRYIYIYKHYEYISFSLVIVMEMGCRLSVGCAIYRNYIIV